MSSSDSNSRRSPQAGRSVAVGLFDQPAQARQAAQALGGIGISEPELGVLPPGSTSTDELRELLVDKGVPEGEARFYSLEAEAGRTVVIAEASGDYQAARYLLLRHGGRDVQSQGATLVRDEGLDDTQVHRAVPRPIDVTDRWEDVISRYEMLWQQHYGTSDATWEQMEPIYEWAWNAANQSRRRGQAWSSNVETELRGAWAARPGASMWSEVAGPVRDVWEDVSHEAALGAEGGGDRRIPRQGTDQAGPARDVVPPRGPPG
jgi:hypothetical protein